LRQIFGKTQRLATIDTCT